MSDLTDLLTMGLRDDDAIRPTLLRVTTELYVAKPAHSQDEEDQFVELALRLVDLVDPATRATVLAQLAAYPSAPAAVLAALRGDEPEMAEALNQALEPPSHDLAALFLAADAEERRLMLMALEYTDIEPAAPISEANAVTAVAALERAALMHNPETFVRELVSALGIGIDTARAIIADVSGEPLLITGIALGMPEAVLQRILLCLNPAIAQSVQRVYELAALHDEIDVTTARRMIAIWQAVPQPDDRPEPQTFAARSIQPLGLRSEGVSISPRPRIAWDEHAQRHVDVG